MTAFYEPLGGGRYRSGPACAGPWSPDDQHGGPPSALIAGALETTGRRDDMMLARLTIEILGPVKVADLEVDTRVSRPGRRVERVEGTLTQNGRPVLAASAWRITRTDSSTPLPAPPPVPDDRDLVDAAGYLGSVEWAPVSGRFAEPGPCAMWTRLRGEIVAGEPPTQLQRVVAVADSGNGVSQVFPMSETWFINPELTVHLHREAVGEWVLLDAETVASRGGVGLASSVLSDQHGRIGRGAQSLLIAPR
ncbi:MAG: thioesterase family protein [Mycobacteriales bacterium]